MLTPPAERRTASGVPAEELFRAVPSGDGTRSTRLLDAIAEAQGRPAPCVRWSASGRARHLADLVLDQLARAGHARGPAGRSDDESQSRDRWPTSSAPRSARSSGDFTSGVDHIEPRASPGAQRRGAAATRCRRLRCSRSSSGPLRDTAQALGKRVIFEAAAATSGSTRTSSAAASRGAAASRSQRRRPRLSRPAAERDRRREDRAGRVILRRAPARTRVVFSCRDDGRGIDLEAVRRLAHRERLAPGATETLRPEERRSTAAQRRAEHVR